MCLFPKLIKNPKYKANKKNGGFVPNVPDGRVFYVPIGCGDCMECRKKKSNEWRVRMLEDIKHNKNGKFVTLTFNNESYSELFKIAKEEGYDKENSIATIGVRRFLERYRKEYKKSLRHWFITELGHNGTENIHLHGIIWTDDIEGALKHWQYGFAWKGYKQHNGEFKNYVNERTVNYIIKYFTKRDIKHKGFKSIILTSSGIGGNYTEREDFKRHKYEKDKTIEYYKTNNGYKIGLPIYYRNKAFTEEEREKLWIEKLDKQKRYIMGIEIDISKGMENYNLALTYYQQQNRDKGYGNGKISWTRAQYEEEIRKMMQEKRLRGGRV